MPGMHLYVRNMQRHNDFPRIYAFAEAKPLHLK